MIKSNGLPTSEDVRAAFTLVSAVGDAIRELGSVPNGELYTRVMPHMSMETYTRIIDTLKGATLVDERNHVLRWIGPKL
jgi:hypothetical protein